jgi:hypothetical protein
VIFRERKGRVEGEKYAVRVLPLFAFESEKKIVGRGP